jgi:hypothetical protein
MMSEMIYDMICHMIYVCMYVSAVGLTPGGSSTAHIYPQTIHRMQRMEHTEKLKN